ncbi:transposase, partial [Bacillus pseudomycoides]|uniref:transposase n=1 Tax=Bacillus pseudomycoides TaxID=64104 RepID=UPI00211D61F7
EYFNNIVERDHQFIKKRVHSMLGLKSFRTATSIISGIEAMHMVKKGQLVLLDKSVQNQVEECSGMKNLKNIDLPNQISFII